MIPYCMYILPGTRVQQMGGICTVTGVTKRRTFMTSHHLYELYFLLGTVFI
jgi:hypothetical protein